jgi:putative N6-adenine-specific DNA methylase
MSRHRCLAVCTPGLEALTADELTGLGVRLRRTLVGGVEFSASDRQLYAANLWLRTAARIVVRIGTAFVAATFEELERRVADLDWAPWLPAGTTPDVRVSSTASRLYHTGAVAERLGVLLASGGEPGPQISVRIMHDRVSVSVDSSGAPLHRRGWRHDHGQAALRETLGAALVLASGWDRRTALVDPMCGSGTIAIEAALLAADRPPGAGRRFAFEEWPSFQPGTWASVIGEARARSAPAVPAPPLIMASDRDPEAIAAATANAERAGVAERVALTGAALDGLRLPLGPGWLVTNPPYGKRVDGGEVGEVFAALGRAVRGQPDWRLGVLVADQAVARRSGLRLDERLHTKNGGIPVTFLVTR